MWRLKSEMKVLAALVLPKGGEEESILCLSPSSLLANISWLIDVHLSLCLHIPMDILSACMSPCAQVAPIFNDTVMLD